jgi:hypothetical protein
MTHLAHSLRRIWSAENRVPRLTGWGTSGAYTLAAERFASWVQEKLGELIAVVHRTAPTIVLVTLNIFR